MRAKLMVLIARLSHSANRQPLLIRTCVNSTQVCIDMFTSNFQIARRAKAIIKTRFCKLCEYFREVENKKMEFLNFSLSRHKYFSFYALVLLNDESPQNAQKHITNAVFLSRNFTMKIHQHIFFA